MAPGPGQSILNAGSHRRIIRRGAPPQTHVAWLRGVAGPVAANPFGSGLGDRLSWLICKALMGTAAADRGPQRPGDGVSPGACPADQITLEPPEEQLPHCCAGQPAAPVRRPVEPAAGAEVEWAVIRRAGTAKEGGTAEPPPAAFVPPAMRTRRRRPPDHAAA